MAEEIEEIVEAPVVETETMITIKTEIDVEGINAAIAREEYRRRNAEAMKEREDIFRRNGLLKPDETLDMDTEAAIRQRCCF